MEKEKMTEDKRLKKLVEDLVTSTNKEQIVKLMKIILRREILYCYINNFK